jgi:hypothetical protein
VSYDGYLFESLTGWLEDLPDRPQVLKASAGAFRSLTESWVALTIPGRPDLHAPLGDVEPEMTFWATALVRLASWYDWPDGRWLAQQFPPARMRAAGLIAAMGREELTAPGLTAPAPVPRELPYALSLRSGWDAESLLAAVSLGRSQMGHLQADAGQVILGWQGRCWITDPGYQQYRPGDERDYTLGIYAHNPPVIGGVAQTQRLGELEQLATDAQGRQHAQVNLSKCYRGLPQTASVRRDLWLSNHGRRGLVVCDTLKGLAKGVEVSHGWQGGHHFAWAFRQGWARLSDGERALWIGTSPDGIAPGELKRHPGTRGPLTLVHSAVLPEGEGVRWWVFVCDPDAGSTAPSLKQAQAAMQVSGVGLSLDAWSFR